MVCRGWAVLSGVERCWAMSTVILIVYIDSGLFSFNTQSDVCYRWRTTFSVPSILEIPIEIVLVFLIKKS